MVISMKKQKRDEEKIILKYTKSHIVKFTAAIMNFLVCLVILVYDMVFTYLPSIIDNTAYTIIWMFSIMLLRREFLKIGGTSNALLYLWSILLITPILLTILEILGLEKASSFRFIATIAKIILNFFLVVFTIIRRVDISDIYSRTSSVYNQMLKSYFLEDESVEDFGDEFK